MNVIADLDPCNKGWLEALIRFSGMTRAARMIVGVLEYPVLTAILIVALTGHALPESQLDWNNCNAAEPDRRIAGCTNILQNQSESSNSRAIALYNRGLAHFRKGDLDRAITDYNEAIRLESGYVAAYDARGRAWSYKDELDRAIADYDEAIRLDPHLGSSYNSRGIAWRAKGDLDRAIADYDEALRLGSELIVVYNNRGISWRAKGDLDRALADYNEVIRLDEKFVLAYINRGVAYLYGGYADRAHVDFLRASDLDPKDAYAYASGEGHGVGRFGRVGFLAQSSGLSGDGL